MKKNKHLILLGLLSLFASNACFGNPDFSEYYDGNVSEILEMGEEYNDYDENTVQSSTISKSRSGKCLTIRLTHTRSVDIFDTLKETFEADISSGKITISQNSFSNSIILRQEEVNEELFKDVVDLIESLDNKVSQVLIDVLVVEFSLSDEDIFDAEWKQLFSNPNGKGNTLINSAIDYGNISGNDPSTKVEGFKTLITSGDKMKTFLNATATKGKATVISSPHIVTSNHREAVFKTGEKVPLLESTTPTTSGPINSYKVEDVGLELTVTPHINRFKDIDLEVFQSINAIQSYDSKSATARMTNREAKTNLTLRDGDVMVLGGFIEEKEDFIERQVPVLSKLPLLGKAFINHNKAKRKTELMVFITPRILTDAEDVKMAVETMVDRTSKKDRISRYLELRAKVASSLNKNQVVIIERGSDGWDYENGNDFIDEIAWRVPKSIKSNKLKLRKKGGCPFGFGFSSRVVPAPVKTYIQPSEGTAFRKKFNVENPADFGSYALKIASDNAACVYINDRLVYRDPMMKTVGGHKFQYWDYENHALDASLFKKGENVIVVLLSNEKNNRDAYFDMTLLGNRIAESPPNHIRGSSK